ncbi:MAG: MspA family porin [Mycolicibacterium sp.]|uniref:MspA family porin n=1 Tax=Mycolicibacterium sp. TaxID=2320850 RepID=UPI003D0E50C7
MLTRVAAVSSALVLAAVWTMAFTTTPATAQPTPSPPDPVQQTQPLADPTVPVPPPGAAVPSGAPAVLKTPDGWELTVQAKDETQEAVAPLTTAVSSREYLVSGTFTGSVAGDGSTELTGASLEAGYRIGCGIIGGPVELRATGGAETVLNPFLEGLSVTGEMKINLRPGTVTVLPVGQKKFTAGEGRISVSGLRIKVDSCVGQSFLQSYATLTSSTADTDDVVTYVGEIKAV